MNAWPYKNDIVSLTARIEAGETVFTANSIDAEKVADKLLDGIVLEAPKTSPDADRWIEWKSKDMPPLHPDTKVQVKWRDGDTTTLDVDCVCGWGESITHYRIVKPEITTV